MEEMDHLDIWRWMIDIWSQQVEAEITNNTKASYSLLFLIFMIFLF